MYSSIKSKMEATLSFLEIALAKFSAKMSKPSLERPTVKCISRSDLRELLIDIRDEINAQGFKSFPATKLIRHMEQSRIITPIPIINSDNNWVENKFWAVGIGVDSTSISPIELLEALEPVGVISYFTALQIHELTTQIPTHHHIAKLKDVFPRKKSRLEITPITSKDQGRTYDLLGSKQFTFEGVPFYCTSRDRHWIQGIQSQYLNDKTIFKVTTLEQTLIDTLHRPLSCGGPSVVFEAWETALESINESRMTGYISNINDMRLNRRIGYMLENLRFEPHSEMKEILDYSLRNIDREDPKSCVSLFTGINYSHINTKWLLEVP